MDIYLAGAEQPVYLRMLEALDVTHIAISFFEWQRRHSTDDLYKHIPESMKVCITPGVARKTIDFKTFAPDYVEFCERNADHALIYDLDAPSCPLDIRQATQRQLAELPNVVMFPTSAQTIEDLSRTYERLGINSRLAKALAPAELRRIRGSLYGSNIADLKTLRIARFTATTTFAWLSSRRYGELWVYARGKLHHYTADDLGKAIRLHAEDITAWGVDPIACMNNDKTALTTLSVRSLQALAASLTQRPRDRHKAEAPTASASGGPLEALAQPEEGTGAHLSDPGPRTAHERPRELLPVVTISDQFGPPKVTSVGASLRTCDTCYLSDVCPRFEAHASCAYALPVEIKTDAQWEAACQALLEIQFQRISFGHFAEQIEGGTITPRLGQEMDRFYKMLSTVKDLKAVPVETGEGVLSRIFGLPAGETQNPATFGDDDNGPQETAEEDPAAWSEEYAAYRQDFIEESGTAEDDYAGADGEG